VTRIALWISYDGTHYAGWQRQHNALAVQQAVETALFKLTGAAIAVTGASRTDAGVHAAGQVAHFDITGPIPPERYAVALNGLLLPDIRIRASAQVPDAFHSRFDSCGKTYHYQYWNAPQGHALYTRTAWHIHRPLTLQTMRDSLPPLLGEHDFAAFLAMGGTPPHTTVRTITDLTLTQQEDLITLSVSGNAFLYNMVRIMAGTLASIGTGKLPPDAFERMLRPGSRLDGGPTAPPHGLTLAEVRYAPALVFE